MIRQFVCAGLGALVLSVATPVAAQDDFSSLDARAKFAWAMRNVRYYCDVSTTRPITFDELPGYVQAGLVMASKDDVVQGLVNYCPQLQAMAAQY